VVSVGLNIQAIIKSAVRVGGGTASANEEAELALNSVSLALSL